MTASTSDNAVWMDAARVAALLAIDPVGLCGAWVRAMPGPVRDRWLEALRAGLPANTPWRRAPLHIADDRLLGGLDLTATLAAGRPIAERGLLAEADGGVVVLPMAERLAPSAAARIATVLDTGEVALERDGLAQRLRARIGIVALDERTDEEDPVAHALLDRVAFHLDLTAVAVREALTVPTDEEALAQARARLQFARVDEQTAAALTTTAAALGIGSLRAPLLALRAARALAALDGKEAVEPQHAAEAARLVLAPRATQLPPEEADSAASAEDATPPPPAAPSEHDLSKEGPLDDVVLAAAQAAIPAGLLARLVSERRRTPARGHGRSGALQASRLRGRPVGTRRGELRAGVRLNVIETLRAAAPWQALRRSTSLPGRQPRISVRPNDFRITRTKQHRQTTTIFVVDASGSQALHRLAEAKGAVELLLADCYVRRDRVALVVFRGHGAEVVLPPTRSLVRAKRSLAGLPGGGGTPLAAGVESAAQLAGSISRRGDTPVLVFLTDGRANVARDGSGGRAQAERDAHAAANQLRALGISTLLIDTSPRPEPMAERVAAELGARYLPLPHADATAMSQAVRMATAS
ncbi:MAG: magnesium chelatase subunit D [Betaproteobacteria bacterium]